MNNQKSYWIKLGGVVVTGLLVAFFRTSKPNETTIWGDDENEPYIAFKGKKPVDAKVIGGVSFWLKGPGCERYASQWFGEKLRPGGKLYVKYNYDFSHAPEYYELRLPYIKPDTDNSCSMKLDSISINSFNDFSRIAGITVHPYYENHYFKVTELSAIIEARNCNAKVLQLVSKYWSGYITCKYFDNQHYRSGVESDLEDNLYYDISKFTNNSEINFNVYAGELYRSEPLDEAKLRGIVSKLSSERAMASDGNKPMVLSWLWKIIQDGKQK